MIDHYEHRLKQAIKSLPPEIRQADILSFGFTVRVANVLRNADANTLDDVLKVADGGTLLRMPNFGRKSLRDLIETIEEVKNSNPDIMQYSPAPEEKLPDYGDDPVISKILSCIKHENYDWIDAYLEKYPEHKEEFNELGITSDAIYVIQRDKFSREMRNSADHFRFNTIYPSVNKRHHLSILGIAPSWLLDMSLENVPSTARLKNCLWNDNILKFSDLLEREQHDFLKIPNFGRKTLWELSDMIIDTYEKGEPPDAENLNNYTVPLKECLLKTIDDLNNEKYRTVLERRLGIHGKVETLEEVAYRFNLTRERIRQIYLKQIRNIKHENWVQALEIKIASFFENAHKSVYIEEIGQKDSWFQGFGTEGELLLKIIEEFTSKKLFLIPEDNKNLISNISNSDWEYVKMNILQKLKGSINMENTESDVEVLVRYEFKDQSPFPYLIKAMREQIILRCDVEHKDGQIVIVKVRGL